MRALSIAALCLVLTRSAMAGPIAAAAGGGLGALAPEYAIQRIQDDDTTSGNPVADVWASFFEDASIFGLFAVTTTTAALGTYALGEASGGSHDRTRALGGAFAGAAAGTLAALAVKYAIPKSWPHRVAVRTAIASTLIATASTITYQLAGGGPR